MVRFRVSRIPLLEMGFESRVAFGMERAYDEYRNILGREYASLDDLKVDFPRCIEKLVDEEHSEVDPTTLRLKKFPLYEYCDRDGNHHKWEHVADIEVIE